MMLCVGVYCMSPAVETCFRFRGFVVELDGCDGDDFLNGQAVAKYGLV